MLASKQIAVVGALLVGLSVIGSAAVAEKRPPWERPEHSCPTAWKTFDPKNEGDLPECHVKREWRKCEFSEKDRRKPLYAHWCPPKPGIGKTPARFED